MKGVNLSASSVDSNHDLDFPTFVVFINGEMDRVPFPFASHFYFVIELKVEPDENSGKGEERIFSVSDNSLT